MLIQLSFHQQVTKLYTYAYKCLMNENNNEKERSESLRNNLYSIGNDLYSSNYDVHLAQIEKEIEEVNNSSKPPQNVQNVLNLTPRTPRTPRPILKAENSNTPKPNQPAEKVVIQIPIKTTNKQAHFSSVKVSSPSLGKSNSTTSINILKPAIDSIIAKKGALINDPHVESKSLIFNTGGNSNQLNKKISYSDLGYIDDENLNYDGYGYSKSYFDDESTTPNTDADEEKQKKIQLQKQRYVYTKSVHNKDAHKMDLFNETRI